MATVSTNNSRFLIGGLIVAVLAVLAFAFLNMPDNRTSGEKIGDAVGKLSDGQGLDDAARELQDRTPAQRLSDGVKDATDGNPN